MTRFKKKLRAVQIESHLAWDAEEEEGEEGKMVPVGGSRKASGVEWMTRAAEAGVGPEEELAGTEDEDGHDFGFWVMKLKVEGCATFRGIFASELFMSKVSEIVVTAYYSS